MVSEQALLRRSIAVTFLVASIGVGFGLLAGSSAIMFDGIFSLGDAFTTMMALTVARLIAKSQLAGPSRLKDRFNMGFWHLEPMVMGVSALMLIGTVTYAFLTALSDLMDGGRHMRFGYAVLYAATVLVIAGGMAFYSRRANKSIKSSLVEMDAKGWLMSSALTGALLLAFILGWLINGTRFTWVLPYIDPIVVALICIAVFPIPIPIIRRALADIFLMTPADLREAVDTVGHGAVLRYGFASHRSYVARVGRGKLIELYFIVPHGQPARKLEEWDAIRSEISDEIGAESPDRWLTIVFTTDRGWAE